MRFSPSVVSFVRRRRTDGVEEQRWSYSFLKTVETGDGRRWWRRGRSDLGFVVVSYLVPLSMNIDWAMLDRRCQGPSRPLPFGSFPASVEVVPKSSVKNIN